jgi:hypothetical protein
MTFLQKATHIYLGIIIPLSIVIPIVPALLQYKRLPGQLKVIVWYLFLSAISNAVTRILAYNYINNMPVMHVYTLLEFVLLALFYREVLAKGKTGILIPLMVSLFTLLCIGNVLFLQNMHTYNTYTKSIEALLIIVLGVFYFKQNLDSIVSGKDRNTSLMYINSGLLIYFSGSFIWFVVYNMTVMNERMGMVMWSIHATLLLLLYVLIAIALWKYKKSEILTLNN